jgi:hypothetical protein
LEPLPSTNCPTAAGAAAAASTPPPAGEALELTEAGKLPRPQEWRRAYREAKHCATILARAAKLRAKAAALAPLAGPSAVQMAAADLSSSSNGSDSSGSDNDGEEKDHRAAVAGRAAKQALAVNMRMPR